MVMVVGGRSGDESLWSSWAQFLGLIYTGIVLSNVPFTMTVVSNAGKLTKDCRKLNT